MSSQTAVQNPTPKHIEFETNAVYPLGKYTIVVDSVFKQDGGELTNILSRLMLADVEND